jgi:16S rRNA (cytidine1402-2'-O)-methyltransferase
VAELEALWTDSRRWPYAAVAFESPKRLAASLAALARIDPVRPMAVCRELTKRFEEIARGSAAELAERFDGPVKGEVTVVIRPGGAPDDQLEGAVAAVRQLVAAGAARRPAADTVAGLLDLSRNELYRRSLAPPD